MKGASGAQVDMAAVEVLDSIGVPLMVDAYPHQNVIRVFQFTRGDHDFLPLPMRFRIVSNALLKSYLMNGPWGWA